MIYSTNKKIKFIFILTIYRTIITISIGAIPAVPLIAQTDPAAPGNAGRLAVVGLPFPYYNSDDGFGLGGRIYFTKQDPAYAPFKWQLWLQIFATTKRRENHEFKADILNFLGTPLRFVFRGGLVRYQSAQYYGIGNDQEIRQIQSVRSGETPINENQPAVPDLYQIVNPHLPVIGESYTVNRSGGLNPGIRFIRERQNKHYLYDRIEPYFQVTTENWMFPGSQGFASNFKWYGGVRSKRYRIQTYAGDRDGGEPERNSSTLLDVDQPTGYDSTKSWKSVNMIRAALVYDSRPRMREKDPNEGVFWDLHLAGVGKGTGSDYTFQKAALTFRHYLELFPDYFHSMGEELVFAYRLQGAQTFGDAPFFEMNQIYTKEETNEGVGGGYGVRGYPSNQYVDNIMLIGNAEMRYTFSKRPWLGGMNWVLLAFADSGRVAHTVEEVSSRGWHPAFGGGMRLVWQKDTLINISHGVSRYESYTAFTFDHMF